MHRIDKILARHLELPLLEPFETSKRRATTSSTVIVEIHSGDVVGYGEATPVKYVTGEDADSVLQDIVIASDVLQGAGVGEYRLSAEKLAEVLPFGKSARAGIEMAMFDAFCKTLDIPLYAYLGGAATRIETDVTISIVSPEQAGETAVKMSERGFKRFKVKVGKDEEEDIARVLAIKESVPECTFILDANQAFTAPEAVNFTKRLLGLGVDISLIEQPVDANDLDGLRYVTEHVDVPVFADEAAQTPNGVLEIVRHKAAGGINIKLQKSGMMGALEIISICRAAGLSLMFGCMLESKIGQSAAVHIACGTHAFSVFDLDSDLLLAEQPIMNGIQRQGPFLNVCDGPGLGCVIDEEAIKRYLV